MSCNINEEEYLHLYLRNRCRFPAIMAKKVKQVCNDRCAAKVSEAKVLFFFSALQTERQRRSWNSIFVVVVLLLF